MILNQITKQFGGEIKFKDTNGGGSTFYFSIELDKYTTMRDQFEISRNIGSISLNFDLTMEE